MQPTKILTSDFLHCDDLRCKLGRFCAQLQNILSCTEKILCTVFAFTAKLIATTICDATTYQLIRLGR